MIIHVVGWSGESAGGFEWRLSQEDADKLATEFHPDTENVFQFTLDVRDDMANAAITALVDQYIWEHPEIEGVSNV